MDFEREQGRMLTFMDLDRAMQRSMMRAMPGVCTPHDVAEMERVRAAYQDLYASGLPADSLVSMDNLDQRIADATEWIARGLDTLRKPEEALPYYEEARKRYSARGDAAAVSRIDDRIADIRVLSGGALDDEIERLRAILDGGSQDALARAKTLVNYGELLTRAGDDFEAEKALIEAETLLESTPNLSRDQILQSLADTLGQLGQPSTPGGSPIERAIEVRAIYQRIYFAFGNVYRDTNPLKAREYEAKLAAFDTPGKPVDTSVISALLDQIRKLGG